MGPGLQGSQASTSRLVCFGGEVTPKEKKSHWVADPARTLSPPAASPSA